MKRQRNEQWLKITKLKWVFFVLDGWKTWLDRASRKQISILTETIKWSKFNWGKKQSTNKKNWHKQKMNWICTIPSGRHKHCWEQEQKWRNSADQIEFSLTSLACREWFYSCSLNFLLDFWWELKCHVVSIEIVNIVNSCTEIQYP